VSLLAEVRLKHVLELGHVVLVQVGAGADFRSQKRMEQLKNNAFVETRKLRPSRAIAYGIGDSS